MIPAHVLTGLISNSLLIARGLLVWGLLCILSALLIVICQKLYVARRLRLQPLASLLIVPHNGSNASLDTMQQFFRVLHKIANNRSSLEKLLHVPVPISFDLVSKRDTGIRYIISMPESYKFQVQNALLAFDPTLVIHEQPLENRLRKLPASSLIRSYMNTGYYAYPLHKHDKQHELEKVNYLLTALANPSSRDTIRIRLVAMPLYYPKADRLARRILHHEEQLNELGAQHKWSDLIASLISTVLLESIYTITDVVYSSDTSKRERQTFTAASFDNHSHLKPARTLSPFELQLAKDVHAKLSQPLFMTQLFAFVECADKDEAKQRLNAIDNAFGVMNVPGYQSVVARRTFSRSHQLHMFRFGLPAWFARNMNILSASELASLYHFSTRDANSVENVSKLYAHQLPSPAVLKSERKVDVVVGQNIYHGQVTTIGLTAEERERHMYVLGGTGNGKTTMLANMIAQDMQAGKGVAVIDPHGDLARQVLSLVPPSRVQDVIYFNPDDLEFPIGLNLLEFPSNLAGNELKREQAFVAEALISIFRKLFSSDDSGGHRIEQILRNCIYTAYTVEHATVFTIYRLLVDKAFRDKVVRELEDGDLRRFWTHEYGAAGGFQQIKMMAGVTAKIGRFYASVQTRLVLDQPLSTIDFDEILNGKILICNFAKGLLGDDTSDLFGTLVLAKLQIASYHRIRLNFHARVPFYAYVDEFQNFATELFTQILSESRKYRLYVTIAEQSTSQQDWPIVENILNNAGIFVCFRSANPRDEEIMLHICKGFVRQGELINLPAYEFYMRIYGNNVMEPLSGRTIYVPAVTDQEFVEKVIAHSRETFGRRYLEDTAHKSEDKLDVDPLLHIAELDTQRPPL